jgi:flagellar motility protein MotE (MotC chaperone)
MKKALPLVLMFAGTSVSAVLVMVLLMALKPELFGRAQRTAPQVALPSTRATTPRTSPAPSGKEKADTARAVAVADSVDSLSILNRNVAALKDSLTAAHRVLAKVATGPAPPDTVVARADSISAPDSVRVAERRAMAKVFDTMQAENAARILNDLPDSEVKEILLAVKKRQAAKIMAALDPGRAARIMR